MDGPPGRALARPALQFECRHGSRRVTVRVSLSSDRSTPGSHRDHPKRSTTWRTYDGVGMLRDEPVLLVLRARSDRQDALAATERWEEAIPHGLGAKRGAPEADELGDPAGHGAGLHVSERCTDEVHRALQVEAGIPVRGSAL
jgi:hypothetical protein